MSNGIPLNDAVRNILFDTAQEMFSKRKDEQKVKSPWCDGVIHTKGKRAGLAEIFGIVFTAVIETDWGKVDIQYIVRETDFRSEDGEWIHPVQKDINLN
jgi:hypothetical protein